MHYRRKIGIIYEILWIENGEALKKSQLYDTLLLSNMRFDDYSVDMRRVVLINILLIISSMILTFFSFYNCCVDYNAGLFITDVTTVVLLIATYIYLRKTHDVVRTALLTSMFIFVLMVGVVYFGEGEKFTIIWTVFYPIFAIFVNGGKRGVLFSLFFFTIVFIIAYSGVGVWLDGHWDFSSFVRYVAAGLGIMVVIYFFELSLDKAYLLVEEARKKEIKYIKTLEECSITDPLTGLYNRRYLDVQFGLLFEKAKKNGSVFALYIFDIDHFKLYNDTYGHIEGDKVLQKIAKVLNTEVFKRESDAVFRLGGEEFCGFIIADDVSKIEQSVQNAKEAIASLRIEHKKSEHKVVTASFGVCSIDSYETKDFDKMYKLADDALYLAKEKGRNRIEGAHSISTL